MLKDMFFSKPNGGLFPGEAASEEPVAKGQPSASSGTPLGSVYYRDLQSVLSKHL